MPLNSNSQSRQSNRVLKGLKNTNWKIYLTLLIPVILVFSSCLENPDPRINYVLGYHFDSSRGVPTINAGEYLPESIYVQAQDINSGAGISDLEVEFIVESGGGSVDQQHLYTDQNGKAATKWKLGTESFQQKAIAKIYNYDGSLLSTKEMYAYGILSNAWNEFKLSPLSGIRDMEADTVNQITWMISRNKIYTRGESFLDWNVTDIDISSPAEIEIDKNGTYYMSTWNGELFKSFDHGQNWIQCTNPIPDYPYYYYFWISGDGDLWATRHEQGIWHSTDEGETWTNENPDVFMSAGAHRLENGWLLTVAGSPIAVQKSEDNGSTWTELPFHTYPNDIFVTEENELIVFDQHGGIFKSTDNGESFNSVLKVSVAYGGGLPQKFVHKFGSLYYFSIPGYGVLKTKNFEQFETIFRDRWTGELYIDHTGALCAVGAVEKGGYVFYYNNNQ